MAKIRVLILLSTFIVVGIFGTIAILYARGFRLNFSDENINIGPTGLLVANSDPEAAQVFVNGELKTATDNTLSLSPNEYKIEIKKEGFYTWEKTIKIEQETVTQIDAFLVPTAPSLTALTFSGVINPVVSRDNTRIAYTVPMNEDNSEKAGLWLIESINLPLGFNRDPRQITDGDLSEAKYEFSPDGRQLLLTLATRIYLLDTSTFTTTAQRQDVTPTVNLIKEEWQLESSKRLTASLSHLPKEIEKVFSENAKDITFSPDENRILYTASGSASLAEDLVPKLPGSSTQPEERSLQDKHAYVYDIREDKNFKISETNKNIYWLPNSLNLIQANEGGVDILDYDGTNRKSVFSGTYKFPHAYSTTSANRILILTNFSTGISPDNLYWVSLK